jgi:predicted transcriptional regulator
MDVHLQDQQRTQLAELSAQTGRSANELVIEAVDRLLADQGWFDAQVRIGIDQIARGEFLDEDEMDERVARMLRG